jgi:hypothetical protein
MKKSQRVRKPTNFPLKLNVHISFAYPNTVNIFDQMFLNAWHCRKLAAWLTKAADYLEQEARK